MERLSIKETLMRRDGMDAQDAEDIIAEAKEALQEYLAEGDMNSAYDVCEEFFGLEPDYLDEFIEGGLI